MLDAIVIGAGMAGITAARDLAASGLSVCVVEARDRIGGRVYSVRDFCDEPVEGGAEFIHGVGAATWPDAMAAGVEARPCPLTRHTMFSLGGRPRWLPWILLHPGVWPSFPILMKVARFKPPDMSAREFIDKQGYRGHARVMAQMVLTAHLPGSVDEVGLLGLLEDNVLKLETGLNHRIVEGYDSVVSHIARDLDVRLGFGVESIDWSGDGVVIRSTGGEELSARAAITTLPLGVLKSGKVRFKPELPAGKHEAFEGLVAGPVVKVLLHFKERFWPRWLANLPCGTGPVTLYWPVFYGAKYETQAVLTAYATGPRAARLSEVSEDEATEICISDLERLFPKADPRGQLVARRRIDWAADPFACGGYTLVRPGGAGSRVKLTAADTGALFWAGSATSTPVIAATVESAFVSGLRAAGDVRALLGGAAARDRPVAGA
ncbi:MAG: NAD(P)/FAD-dependent oxidoreductase [bacterium]